MSEQAIELIALLVGIPIFFLLLDQLDPLIERGLAKIHYRQLNAWQKFALAHGFTYIFDDQGKLLEKLAPKELPLIDHSSVSKSIHHFSTEFEFGRMVIFEWRYRFKEQHTLDSESPSVCVILIESNLLPKTRFSLYRKDNLKWLGHMGRLDFEENLQKEDIWLPEHRNFSFDFFLTGPDKAAVRQLFDSNLVDFFASLPRTYAIEGFSRQLLIFQSGTISQEQILTLAKDGQTIFKQLSSSEIR